MKSFITEISEEDFRKLNLKVWQHERVEYDTYVRYEMIEKSLNDILDEQIALVVDPEEFYCPVTIAIHTDPTEENFEELKHTYPALPEKQLRDTLRFHFAYWDKFMNRFTGVRTFQIGWDIEHLYSTRDYYEAHGDYWRVKKSDTKAIYRVHLDKNHKKD